MNRSSGTPELTLGSNLDTKFVPGRVSVIIPTYNYGQFILCTIDSVLRQTVSDVEVVVVDDGSTDGTSELLQSYSNSIQYIYQENAGLSAARNTGMASSTGEFIQFLDADDMLGPSSLEFQLGYLKKHPEVQISVCRNRRFQRTTGDCHPIPSGSWNTYRDNLDLHLCFFNIAPPHAFLSRRTAVAQTGWFDTGLRACEDYDFWIRAAVRGFIPHYNPVGFVYYRDHSKSMSANRLNQYLHDAILHQRLSLLLDEHPEYPSGKRLEGLLAFSSAALITAARLRGHQSEGTKGLLELACRRTEEAKRIAVEEKNDWNILIKLYCLRILHILQRARFGDCTGERLIYDNLFAILSAVNAPLSKISLVTDAFLSSLLGSWEYYGERRQLRRLTVNYLRSHIFAM
jgi:glycosyltransferase involved in cell wall biosynthesis